MRCEKSKWPPLRGLLSLSISKLVDSNLIDSKNVFLKKKKKT